VPHPHPHHSPLFPYTTLFRSVMNVTRDSHTKVLSAEASALDLFMVSAAKSGGAPEETPSASAVPRRQRRAARPAHRWASARPARSEEHTSELQSRFDLVCRLL